MKASTALPATRDTVDIGGKAVTLLPAVEIRKIKNAKVRLLLRRAATRHIELGAQIKELEALKKAQTEKMAALLTSVKIERVSGLPGDARFGRTKDSSTWVVDEVRLVELGVPLKTIAKAKVEKKRSGFWQLSLPRAKKGGNDTGDSHGDDD